MSSLIKKGYKLYSILFLKCPKCHEEDLFKNRNPYNLSEIFEMPKECPNCGQKFEIEPGFYFGAMYVSYAVCVAYCVTIFVAYSILYPAFSLEFYLITAVGSMVLLTPVFFRLSRALWINFFVHYDKDHKVEQKPTGSGDYNKTA